MRKALFAVVAAVAVVVAVSPFAQAAPPLAEQPEVASALRLYSLWAEDQRQYLGQPGVMIALVHDQDLVWAHGFGVADLATKQPVAPDTVFRLGSISKTFTATAAMQLVEAGTLRLDDPVSKHIPEFRYRDRFPGAPPITVWNLLTHTSGLPREAAFPYWTDRKFPTLPQILAGLAAQENVFEPSTRYKYSNLGIALLGKVVESAAGRPYAEVVRERIFKPLGMTSSYVTAITAPPERRATGYLVRRADGTTPPAPDTDSQGLTPAANLSSTAEDLARYLAAHLSQGAAAGGAFLRASTLREMQRVQWLAEDWSSGRGLGFAISRQGERTLVGHGGWVAGHRAQISFDPKAKLGVIVLTNSDEGGPGSYARQAVEILFPALERASRPEPLPAVVLENLERYTGTYHDPWGSETEVLVLGGRLAMVDHERPPSSNPKAAPAYLTPVSEHVFVQDDAGERVIFELRPDGGVARIKNGENYLFPADCGELGADLRCTWR